jgi:hypothetical protein
MHRRRSQRNPRHDAKTAHEQAHIVESEKPGHEDRNTARRYSRSAEPEHPPPHDAPPQRLQYSCLRNLKQ